MQIPSRSILRLLRRPIVAPYSALRHRISIPSRDLSSPPWLPLVRLAGGYRRLREESLQSRGRLTLLPVVFLDFLDLGTWPAAVEWKARDWVYHTGAASSHLPTILSTQPKIISFLWTSTFPSPKARTVLQLRSSSLVMAIAVLPRMAMKMLLGQLWRSPVVNKIQGGQFRT